MPADRFFCNVPLSNKLIFILDDPKEFHHIIRVMKSSEGDIIEIVNGCSELAQCQIIKISAHKVSLEVINVTVFPKKSILTLYQALPRPHRLDLIVEKGTELGINHFIFFPGEKSEIQQLSPNRLTRLQTLAISAMKQCGRTDLPSISVVKNILKWKINELPPLCYFGDLSPTAPPFVSLHKEHLNQDLGFIIGPESGLSEFEEKHIRALGAKGTKLHPFILKTDTASLVVAALLRHQEDL
ncbi:hypothetical protein CLAVI_000864 [Candidatus Clavichlamydia salmonicola]|uniref:RsmE family RNA methyltransferase n=1 Tax=Candidatus Clavichlamydia salmonicola TaxID=469812 RepID=UPI001890D5B2|nr:RsmE family RNA methyltransferase [Candidatus Clavichlamydia salmonicola]MBF5051223.1 hypothetical protein [Candidatus Clavichlamydia salmonicola]